MNHTSAETHSTSIETKNGQMAMEGSHLSKGEMISQGHCYNRGGINSHTNRQRGYFYTCQTSTFYVQPGDCLGLFGT